LEKKDQIIGKKLELTEKKSPLPSLVAEMGARL